jgi:uncharacterized membrane protein YfcA
LVQAYGAWKMRHAISWQRIWPFLLGGVFGVPIGAYVLRFANPSYLRAATGAFLVLYAIYGLTRPAPKPVQAGTAADVGVGAASGMLGATMGFPGILVVIWSGLRGWTPDVQRAVFQPAGVALLVMCWLALGATGSFSAGILIMFVFGLPALIAGTWAGFALYGRLDEASFRRIMLVLRLVSGVPLILGVR